MATLSMIGNVEMDNNFVMLTARKLYDVSHYSFPILRIPCPNVSMMSKVYFGTHVAPSEGYFIKI